MSDRAFFVDKGDEPERYKFADVLIPVSATNEEIATAADQFVRFPGPHKVIVKDRTDPRFVEFCRYLEEEHAMREDDNIWGYSVRLRDDV